MDEFEQYRIKSMMESTGDRQLILHNKGVSSHHDKTDLSVLIKPK
jgi:hypothetical protein